MAVPFSSDKVRGRGARESRRLLPKDRAVYADADNKPPKLQPIWQDSANSLPRAPTISAPNFLVEESPVSSVAIIRLGPCTTTDYQISRIYRIEDCFILTILFSAVRFEKKLSANGAEYESQG